MSALLALALFSGLHGTVTRGPTQPVCRVGKPCSAPAVGATLSFVRAGHATTIHAGKGGRYALRLAPGLYIVRLIPQQKIGGLKPTQVRVRRGVDARVDFAIDTGIR
jgi:hypothetical protein